MKRRMAGIPLVGLVLALLACALPGSGGLQGTLETSLAATLSAQEERLRSEGEMTVIAQSTSFASTEQAYKRLLAEQALQHQRTQAAMVVAATPRSTPTPEEAPTPYYFAYSTPMPLEGTGPFLISAHDDVVLILRPEPAPDAPIEFVLSLVLHFSVAGEPPGEGSTLDFSIYDPESGHWASNQGRNDIPYGMTGIEYKYPDPYVGRDGTVVLDVRNYGDQDIQVEGLAIRMVARGSDGIERTYGLPAE